MLEAYSHNYLKNLLQKEDFAWPHNLTLSRLIARSLRRKDKSIFNLKINNQNDCWIGVLIPISLYSKDLILLLTEKQRHHLIKFELPKLRKQGLRLATWEGLQPPPGRQLWLLDYPGLLNAFRSGYLDARQLIIPEVELFPSRMREAMAITVTSADWDAIIRAHPSASSALVQCHDHLTRDLFSKATSLNGNVRIDDNETYAFRDLVSLLGECPLPWPYVFSAIDEGWANWAELKHKTLDWDWHLQPLEPMLSLKRLFQDIPFVMLSGAMRNNFLLDQYESFIGSFNVKVTLGTFAQVAQEPINLFVPLRQPLPNTEYFVEYLLDQTRRLILGLPGLTILLIDDDNLLRKLTSELASEFGKRVVYESTFTESNGVVCCSSSWWLHHQEQLPSPEQLIISTLPFSTLESPLTSARVNAYKLQGLDWFRDLLLPDLLTVLPKLVQPLRLNEGRVAVLDGRLRSRSWGKKVFDALQPWTPLERLLPH